MQLHITHEIERLLVAGYSPTYIQQQLHLSPRTFDRYRQKTLRDEKEVMLGLSTDLAMERITEIDRKFNTLHDQALKISQDSTADGDVRLGALSAAAEILKQRLYLIKDGPTLVSHLRGYPKSIERYTRITISKSNNNNNSLGYQSLSHAVYFFQTSFSLLFSFRCSSNIFKIIFDLDKYLPLLASISCSKSGGNATDVFHHFFS
jgi:hypothetical protein